MRRVGALVRRGGGLVRGRGTRGEAGQATLLIVGFAVALAMFVAVVVDSSAAYLQRQGLDNLADGAALHAADRGAAAAAEQSLDEDRLTQQARAVQVAAADYLRRAKARERFPGLTFEVRIARGAGTVTVVVRAPLDPPLPIPGAPKAPVVSASGTAAVVVQR